jgi:RNA polymerase sigma factor (sigma-70 family)
MKPHHVPGPVESVPAAREPVPAADVTVERLLRWHAGDRGALDELLRETEPWLRAAIRPALGARVRRVEDSADFAQSAVLRFLVHGPRFLPANQAQFRALMRRIALNEVLKRHRRMRSMAQETQSTESRERYGDALLELAVDSTRERPTGIVSRGVERAWMRLALELLEEQERELLRAREIDGREWDDIARELGFDSGDAARMACVRLLPKVAKVIRKLQQGRLPELLADEPVA